MPPLKSGAACLYSQLEPTTPCITIDLTLVLMESTKKLSEYGPKVSQS